MKNENKFITEVKQGFQNNKGKASLYCFNKEIIPNLVYEVIKQFKAKRPDSNILVAVDKFETRRSIRNFIDKKSEQDNIEYEFNCLSADYINLNYGYHYHLTITIGVNNNYNLIKGLSQTSIFTLCILTENIMNNDFITGVRSILPDITPITKVDTAIEANIYSPVEENRIGIELDDTDRETYAKYTEFINTSIKIFGELSNIEKCKNGDARLNISAANFRETLARENGWSEELNTSIDFHKQIDEIYNPNSLYERACTFYNITRQRRDFVTDNESKLEAILKICKEHEGKRILIISKRGEFAAKVTKYINANSDIKCGDYHDCIEDAILTNEDGTPILVKSGKDKGKPKIVKSKAISSLNLASFNEGRLNVLSIKNSSNSDLKTVCDIVVITSPLCDDIITIKKRFNKTHFNGIVTSLYKVYCKDTIEHETLRKQKESPLFKIIEDEENFIGYDENFGAVVL